MTLSSPTSFSLPTILTFITSLTFQYALVLTGQLFLIPETQHLKPQKETNYEQRRNLHLEHLSLLPSR